MTLPKRATKMAAQAAKTQTKWAHVTIKTLLTPTDRSWVIACSLCQLGRHCGFSFCLRWIFLQISSASARVTIKHWEFLSALLCPWRSLLAKPVHMHHKIEVKHYIMHPVSVIEVMEDESVNFVVIQLKECLLSEPNIIILLRPIYRLSGI